MAACGARRREALRTQSTLVVVLVAVTTITMGMAPLGASQGTEKTQQEPATPALAPTEDRRERNHRLPLDADRPHDGVDRPDRLDDEAPVPRPNPNQRQAQPAQGLAPDDPGCLPHPPIRIVDDAMFQLGPAVGVTNPTAAGTAEDPYVIEGWCITPQAPEIVEQAPFGPVESAGIAIDHTEAHVVIRDNRIDGNAVDNPRVVTQQQVGIDLVDAANVAIANNTITNNDDGVVLDESSGTTIANNTITNNNDWGVYSYRSSGTTITNNTITNNNDDGVDLGASSGVAMRDNEFGSNGVRIGGYEANHYQHSIQPSNTVNGEPLVYVRNQEDVHVEQPAGQVILANTTNATVENVDVSDTSTGLQLGFTDNTTIANNTVTNNNFDGVLLYESSGATIANNTITINDDGVLLYRSSGTTIATNTITNNNDDGVDLYDSSGVEVHQNNIHDNDDFGLEVFAGDTVHAENNWWGAANGPSGGETDACTDANADGDGDAITTDDAEVCFDPWRTSPNPDAGAGG